jgi:hypothetical protein
MARPGRRRHQAVSTGAARRLVACSPPDGMLRGMDDGDLPLPAWSSLDDFAEQMIGESGGKLWPTLVVAFVGDDADVILQGPVFVGEHANDILTILVDFIAAISPDRVAVFWPNRYELPDGTVYWAQRVNTCDLVDGRRVWRTRLHPYTVDEKTRAIEVLEPFDLDDPPDPQTHRLRTAFDPASRRRVERHGFLIPPSADWDCAVAPGSTTLEGYTPVFTGPMSWRAWARTVRPPTAGSGRCPDRRGSPRRRQRRR